MSMALTKKIFGSTLMAAFAVAIVLLLSIQVCIHARALTEEEAQLVEVDNAFGFKLFSKINESEDGNVFISPLSVSMVLGMALNGADGDTKQAITDALAMSGLTDEEINRSYQSLIGLIESLDPDVTLELANSVWYSNSYGIKQDYLDSTQTYFDAEVSALDFRSPFAVNAVNNWVNQKTHGKISEIVDRFPNNTVAAILNAVYFEGTWETQFKKSDTHDSVFYLADETEKPCNMMQLKNDFLYSYNENFEAIDLPYGNGNYSMTILLPHSKEENQHQDDQSDNWTVEDIAANLTPQNWDDWTGELREQEVQLYLPRFSLQYDIEMNDVLSELGMGVAFDMFNADFSRMSDEKPLWIDKVQHRTFIEVDGKGTRAAAVTYSIGVACSALPSSQMVVDRPFVLVIREQHTNSILFLGKIMEPDFSF